MSSGGKYHFLLSENATGAQTAAKDIKVMLGDDAGLAVVPHFKLPQWGERFDDTEGRFPMLPQLKTFFENTDSTGSRFWFAEVLPEGGGDGRSEFLAIYCGGGEFRLAREMVNKSIRYIGTLVDE